MYVWSHSGWHWMRFGIANLVPYAYLAFAAIPLPECGLVAWAYVCVNLLRSFVCENYNAALHDWLRSCHTAGRDCFNDFLGNTGFRFVEVGNLLCSRVVLLLLLCSAKGCRWIVEQPEGSSLSNHPRFQELLGHVRVAQLNCYGLWGFSPRPYVLH